MVIRERERLIYKVNTEKYVLELIDEQSTLEIGLSVTESLSGKIAVLILSKRERGKKNNFHQDFVIVAARAKENKNSESECRCHCGVIARSGSFSRSP